MLDWMKGNEGANAPDDSKLQEPPETPGHVFAIRAFKSAIFGTPGAEEENESKTSQPKQSEHQRSKSDSIKLAPPELKPDLKPPDDATVNPSGSPTKSILVTPGTALRRKTVSFGESVVDNEGKRPGSASKPAKTPPNPSGSISSQWMSGSSDGSGKPRSKLTQTLMNARDNASKNSEGPQTDESTENPDSPQLETLDNEDITINLEDPHSESGKYWKTEFDNYRVKTNREIKKLVHYRSIAKSYARKKDSEAMRLADKLKEEEEKVAEMERQVSRLASSMVGQESTGDKERLVQDLTKQTALALQYKQQVTSLRNTLEKHDVVSDAANIAEKKKEQSSPVEPSDELHKTQQELKQANAKIEEMQRQVSELSTLQDLAQSSEKKAQALEQENNTLKQTLARVKQEMSRYEGRRKDKETRLKQREARLEQRIQEYREKLKTVSHDHRESEENLRNTFETERRHMQKQIDLLKLRLGPGERFPALPSAERQFISPRKDIPRKDHTGVQTFDFGVQEHEATEEEPTDDIEPPPSPSPRSKVRESGPIPRSTTLGSLRARRNAQEIAADEDEVTHYLNKILPKPRHESHKEGFDEAPPSSPPDVSALKSLNRTFSRRRLGDGQRSYRSLNVTGQDDTKLSIRPAQRERPHINTTLDSLADLPYRNRYPGYTISAGERVGKRYSAPAAAVQRDLPSPERVAAAKLRYRQRKSLGKENV
ncbi:unnamed protein product [Penicillium salamii]|uniref:Spindle pole body-associated protein cut12 domain-containing protein n=1 Tax=Penicillium salamii TaxID=1612424 RepID=A0A9W4IBN1_9EURO|nr:unnamed protein product [Penicillium salamii]CAG8254873.1 unnamed protein product [Penicillium salamii]CAG8263350.1 unnamed protein product [Penicillium salamii]CAG8376344.1 unnamed protein product [Penicillium salamii]CAG8400535.1 unnamed protein product [Penicillium salamii]